MADYSYFPKYILRTPTNSFNSLSKINKIDFEFFENDTVFLHALRIASVSLYNEFVYRKNKQISAKKNEQLFLSLLKYYIRYSTRATPFGLFAGLSLGEISSEETKILLNKAENHKPHIRLDMNFVCFLIKNIENIPEIRQNLLFYPNDTIYKVGKKFRYIEYVQDINTRKYQISSVENNIYLNKILKIVKKGISFENLIQYIKNFGYDFEIAKKFIEELIKSQILISDLLPIVTGMELFDFLCHKLSNFNLQTNNFIFDLHNDVKLLNTFIIGEKIEKYDVLKNKIKILFPNVDEKNLFQIDLINSTKENKLNSEIIDNVYQGLHILNKLTYVRTETNITKFKMEFYKRYETEEIPLLLALDTEIGLGYLFKKFNPNSQIINDLPLNQKDNFDATFKIEWNKITSFLLSKLSSNKENKTITIIDEDLRNFNENWNDLPITFSVMVKILQQENDYKIILNNAGGSSAVNLFSRFAYSDSEINNYIFEITKKEEYLLKDKILAEIVHLPEDRAGNILSHPAVKKYEIPILTQTSVSDLHTINLEDLLISVKNNKIVICSKKLKKEIIPYLSNTHNFIYNSIPVYQFLAELQFQNLRNNIFFSWGFLENQFNFFPRVEYKNIILSLATWKIFNYEIKDILKCENEILMFEKFQTIILDKKIPNNVVLVEGDNELFIALDNIIFMKMLLSIVKNKTYFVLKEFLFNTKNALIKDENTDCYTNEFIFSFYKNS